MDTFHWISVAVSMILGLGVARLLTGIVAVFHARRDIAIDWLPLVWVTSIFVQQIDFWWSLEELATLVPVWSLPAFLLLVGLVLSLFLAAALILPPAAIAEATGLRQFFDLDGRWALLAIAGFNGVAMVANWAFWAQGPLTPNSLLNLVLVILPIVAFAGSRPVQVALTPAYLLTVIWSVSHFSPPAY